MTAHLESLLLQLDQKISMPIDPVEFGEIKGAVSSLRLQVADLKTQQEAINRKLDTVIATLSEARGGWKTLMALAGCASAVSAGITWLVTHAKG